MKESNVTLIIPTYNKINRLKYLLESLTIQAEEVPFNVIIVDDGSTDGSKALIHQYVDRLNLQYLYQTNGGRSHARNFGLSHAASEYIIFCDDDMILSRAFVKNHYEALTENQNSLIHGRIWNLPYVSFFEDPATGRLMENAPAAPNDLAHIRKFIIGLDAVHNQELLHKQRRTTTFEKYLSEIHHKQIRELEFLMCTGGNFSCSREALLEAGGFNEDIDLEWGTEDLELGYRLKKNNVNFIYSHDAYNYHISHYRNTYEKELYNSINLFYKEHGDSLILALPKLLLREIKSLEEFKAYLGIDK